MTGFLNRKCQQVPFCRSVPHSDCIPSVEASKVKTGLGPAFVLIRGVEYAIEVSWGDSRKAATIQARISPTSARAGSDPQAFTVEVDSSKVI